MKTTSLRHLCDKALLRELAQDNRVASVLRDGQSLNIEFMDSVCVADKESGDAPSIFRAASLLIDCGNETDAAHWSDILMPHPVNPA